MNSLIFAIAAFLIHFELNLSDTRASEIFLSEIVQNDTTSNITDAELLSSQLSSTPSEEQLDHDGHSHSDVSVKTVTSEVQHPNSAILVQCGLLPNTSQAPTFLDFVMGFNTILIAPSIEDDDPTYYVNHGIKKITCVPRNTSSSDNLPSVRILNSSELLQHLGSRNSTSGRCTVVLFYAPWCVFSARVAPHYNALARAFPKLDVVAIDAFHFSNLNSRFGTIAVPNVMIFHSAKAIARFNGSERTLANLTSFVSNITGIQADLTVEVTEADYVGPLQSEPSQEPDYLLLLSWVFVILCCIVGVIRSSAGLRVWNTLVAMGHHEQHHHQHID